MRVLSVSFFGQCAGGLRILRGHNYVGGSGFCNIKNKQMISSRFLKALGPVAALLFVSFLCGFIMMIVSFFHVYHSSMTLQPVMFGLTGCTFMTFSVALCWKKASRGMYKARSI